MPLPTDAKARKEIPVYSGCVAYFPDALAAIAQLSFLANEQHNPGEPMHWSKGKSTDHLDCSLRHMIDDIHTPNGHDAEGVLHIVKNGWRALAQIQTLADSGVDVYALLKGSLAMRKPAPEFGDEALDKIRDAVERNKQLVAEENAPGLIMETDEEIERGEREGYDVVFTVLNTEKGVDEVQHRGPYPTVEAAADYARRNPERLLGLRSIHPTKQTLRKP